MNRRDFLYLATATASTALIRTPGWAQTAVGSDAAPTPLKAVKRNLDIKGRPANVFGLERDNGAPGVVLNAGQDFNVALINELSDPTLIHWHGLTPPWPLDGVPDVPAPLMKPGETRVYKFPVREPGTYWMHAHTLQEQNLLAAPLIVQAPGDGESEQEVVILLHDFSFTSAEELLARLKSSGAKTGMGMAGMGQGQMMAHMANMGGMGSMHSGAMAGMGKMDVNDIDYDAYLANDRTLDDPEVVRVALNDHVRLRIINGAAATAVTIDTGALSGELVAVDGQDITPAAGSAFPVAMGQRLDIRLHIPKEGGAFPVLALREDARERTGILLATPNAAIRKVPVLGERKGPIVNLDLEQRLTSKQPLSDRKPDRRYAVRLTGNMANYSWAVEAAAPLVVRPGERVEISMLNMSMMTHPMHLHGHHFQVVAINGRKIHGAVRDTVVVTPMSTVTIAFDTNNPGRWAFHCHHLYHMAAGMMTFVNYEGAA